jgi:peptidoglycan/xylan/chitin deacetylase (PgdA/CDA1 family)
VTDGQVADGLAPGRNHLLVTFDDGYFNNAQVLPVLEQAGVPATFYVSTSHVLEGKAFWWDVLAREMRQRGAAERAINAEIRRMKIWSNDRIEASLKLRFGERALRPRGDLDRPLAASELRDMARHPLVSVGNHTCDHAILPNCTPAERRRQIGDCQIALAAITGKAPTSIAYPNGDYSREVVEDAQAAGLRVGVTVRPCTTHLPLAAGKASMTLGRYLVWGDEDLRVQRRKMAASFVPGNLLRTLMLSAY